MNFISLPDFLNATRRIVACSIDNTVLAGLIYGDI